MAPIYVSNTKTSSGGKVPIYLPTHLAGQSVKKPRIDGLTKRINKVREIARALEKLPGALASKFTWEPGAKEFTIEVKVTTYTPLRRSFYRHSDRYMEETGVQFSKKSRPTDKGFFTEFFLKF